MTILEHINKIQENLNRMVDKMDDDTDYYDATYHLEQIKEKVVQEPKTDYKAFAEWVSTEIFSKDWEYNKDSFAEIACRKLNKLGVVDTDGTMWIYENEALEQEPKVGWNNHQIACMLADLFGDACACNYNGIDEWLPELCDFKDTCCPNPVGVACWEQFLKYSQSRYTECGYEIRDKNALQEPTTGRWEWVQYDSKPNIGNWHCSECRTIIPNMPEETDNTPIYKYCPNCGAKMENNEN